MAIIRPSLSELLEQVLADADGILGGVEARLERSLIHVLLTAPAGALHGAYGYLQQIADDAFPDTAGSEALERWAAIFGISRGAASYAQGWLGAPGTLLGTIPVGAILRRSDGREYERLNFGALPDGTGVFVGDGVVTYATLGLGGTGWAIPVRAVESGAAGNAIAGTDFSFVSPYALVPPVIESVLDVSGAVDSEPDELLRRRLLDRYRNPPQGGTAAEFKAWALGASNPTDTITRAFVKAPSAGSNLVTVYVVDDGGGIPSANPPTPTPQSLVNAAAAINLRRPLSSAVTVIAPTLVAMTLTIDLTPDTPATRTAIQNEIDSFLFDNHAPGQEIPLSILQAVISNAAGGADARITSPSSNFTPGPAELLYRGGITWT